MWREVLRIINEGTVEGLALSKAETHDRLFLRNLRHSNEVFAAFKVHTMGVEMAAKLIGEDGKLKPFDKWRQDVASICSHQTGAWLRTEYDTAVIRAHAAADWQEFQRNRDIMPNLRWMPTTSPQPESSHAAYWRMKLTLPIDDPFWNNHHPGDRWNCKCSLEATDEPVVRPADLEPTQPQRGLENNPGKDGHTFSDNHPYFPSSCATCPVRGASGFTDKLKGLFRNAKKDCYNCGKFDSLLNDMKQGRDIEELFDKLQYLSGSDYIRQIRKIAKLKIYRKIEKDIFCAISESNEDYHNLVAGAKKAVRHGFKVYILSNPGGVRSADYIFERKGVYKMLDLKTIKGKSSIGNRLMESIGQTNRVFLNLATTYSANRMATEIKSYFEANDEALEVVVAVGNKMVSVDREFISSRNYHRLFRKMVEK